MKDSFFYFLRPVSNFLNWILFLSGISSLEMKIFSLAINILLLCSFYYFLSDIFNFNNIKVSKSFVLMFTTMFFVSDISIDWNIWISQRNELLMILFYILSFKYYLKFLNNYNFKYFAIFALLYFFSFLSKQSSLHLPLVLIVLHFWGGTKFKINSNSYIVILGLIFIFGLIFNLYFLDENEINLVIDNLWKKPFALAGTTVITIFPLLGSIVYDYLAQNSNIALLLIIPSLILFACFYFRSRNIIKKYLYIFLIFIITFFPMLGHAVYNRNHSIQVIFFITILSLIITKYKYYIRYFYIYLLIYFILSIFNSNFKKDEYKSFVNNDNYISSKLSDYLEKRSTEDIIIIANPKSDLLSYVYFYYKNHAFGKSNLLISPVIANGDYQIKLDNNIFDIYSIESNPQLAPSNLIKNSPFIISKKIKSNYRFYSLIRFSIPAFYDLKKISLIYFKNYEWHEFEH